ncbi:MAG: hypothetical protein Fur0032_08510 [Terrimicrobiaceae bacterium]
MKAYLLIPMTAMLLHAAVAQEPPAPGQPPPPPPGKREKGPKFRDNMREHFLKDLSPQDRQRFEQARNQAMTDPSIAALRDKAESANREFFEAVRNKIREIDPGLEEIIKKAMASKSKDGLPRTKERKGPDGGLANLTEAERQKFMAARETARSSPAVQQAEAARAAAKTPEEKRSAVEAFTRAMRDAMLTADPSLKDVLDKVRPPRPHSPPGAHQPPPPPVIE